MTAGFKGNKKSFNRAKSRINFDRKKARKFYGVVKARPKKSDEAILETGQKCLLPETEENNSGQN